MSGQAGSRGYLVQVLTCVLESFENEEWQSLAIEPNLDSEEVDIVWYYPEKTRVVQVKHSQNPISISKVQTWAQKLEEFPDADEYILTLIGPCNTDVTKKRTIGRVNIPTPLPLNVTAFVEQAAQRFDRYLHSKGISEVPPFARELIIQALATKLTTYSTEGSPLSREDFDNQMIEWVLVVYPNGLKQAAEEKIEKLKLQLREQERIATFKYELKYNACLEALNIVDKVFLPGSKRGLTDKFHGISPPQTMNPYELGNLARECHNKLVLSCDTPEIIRLFRRTMGLDGKFSLDVIVDLRSAIRRELGFGEQEVDLDRDNAWFATIGLNIDI